MFYVRVVFLTAHPLTFFSDQQGLTCRPGRTHGNAERTYER